MTEYRIFSYPTGFESKAHDIERRDARSLPHPNNFYSPTFSARKEPLKKTESGVDLS